MDHADTDARVRYWHWGAGVGTVRATHASPFQWIRFVPPTAHASVRDAADTLLSAPERSAMLSHVGSQPGTGVVGVALGVRVLLGADVVGVAVAVPVRVALGPVVRVELGVATPGGVTVELAVSVLEGPGVSVLLGTVATAVLVCVGVCVKSAYCSRAK